MSNDAPRPERVTLTAEERETLWGLAEALRDEADLAARPGQMERLNNIAAALDHIARGETR